MSSCRDSKWRPYGRDKSATADFPGPDEQEWITELINTLELEIWVENDEEASEGKPFLEVRAFGCGVYSAERNLAEWIDDCLRAHARGWTGDATAEVIALKELRDRIDAMIEARTARDGA